MKGSLRFGSSERCPECGRKVEWKMSKPGHLGREITHKSDCTIFSEARFDPSEMIYHFADGPERLKKFFPIGGA